MKDLKVGDQVLLLLPTKMNKIDLQWQGPYVIVNKVRDNYYVIELDGENKMFQANILRKCNTMKPVKEGNFISVL